MHPSMVRNMITDKITRHDGLPTSNNSKIFKIVNNNSHIHKKQIRIYLFSRDSSFIMIQIRVHHCPFEFFFF